MIKDISVLKSVYAKHPIIFCSLFKKLYDKAAQNSEGQALCKDSFTSKGSEKIQFINDKKVTKEQRLKRSMALIERNFGPHSLNFAKSQYQIGLLYADRGEYSKAEPFNKRSLAINEKVYGPDNTNVATSLLRLGHLYYKQARHREAEPIFKRALAIKKNAHGPNHPEVAWVLNYLALLYTDQARYEDAEPLYKRSLAIDEKALGPDHPEVAATLNNLGLLYVDQARYDEAEPLLKRSLEIEEKAQGIHSSYVAISLNNLAILYHHQNRYGEAETFYKRALRINEEELRPDHPYIAANLGNLGRLQVKQARYEDAEPLLKRALKIRRKTFGSNHPAVGRSLNDLALLYTDQARYEEAGPLYKRSLAIYEKALLPNHPSIATSLGNLALLYNERDKPLEALPFARRASAILRGRGNAASASKSLGAESERKDNLYYFERHASTAFRVGKADPSQSAALHEEAFEVIQLAQTSSAASALAQMTARIGSGDAALAKAVRSQQDLLGRWRALDKKLIDELSKPGDKRSPERETRLRDDIRETNNKLDTLNQQLAEQFPQYAELVNAEPLQVAEVQKLLGTEEALVLYNGSYAWIVLRDTFRMLDLDIDQEELESAVSEIRTSFNPVQGKVPPFPHAVAHTLYKKIFAPIESELSGIRQIMVVPDGPLTSLPLSVLVRSSYTGDGEPEWLAQKYALTTLPSVSSLKALRVLAMKTGLGSDPFAGFGNPVLKGDPDDRRGIEIVPIFNKGDKADTEALRQLAALPETGEELRVIARSLGAGADTVYLGEKATEARVKTLDLSGTNVIAFATHGLIAGDIKGLAEPGLVLTPPATASSKDDGVLTASEVAQLKLHPGLVILSACNTAAADGTPGAEGLSGLAKAFFYAGSQSLLVSHWAVPSEAAKRLTTGMFTDLEEDPGIGFAEALRRSMMRLAANDNYSHPIHWAPFVVVGEGAVTR